MKTFISSVLLSLCLTPLFVAAQSTPTLNSGFDKLQFLQGDWQMQPAQKTKKSPALQPGEPYAMSVTPVIANRYLRATGNQQGTAFELTFGFDAQHNEYRLSIFDSSSGVPDFYHGTFDKDGVLHLANEHGFRLEIQPNQPNGWTAENFYSKDGGQTWTLYGRHIARQP